MNVNDIDFASLRLVPTNTGRWLGKMQEYEYRLAMRLIRQHSLLFEGNDIDARLIRHHVWLWLYGLLLVLLALPQFRNNPAAIANSNNIA